MISRDEVAAGMESLPSLSTALADLLDSFDRDGVGISELVDGIGRDQGLSARVLRVANSPFYGFSSRIGSIREAVVVLGFNTLRSIAVSSGLIDAFPGLDCRAFWQHGAGAGACARSIARKVGVNPEVAFVAGLLHDVGKLVFETKFGAEYAEAIEWAKREDCEIRHAEKALLGIDHAEIGFEVANRWKFPVAMQHAIRDHHDPQGEKLTDVVHLANALSHALDLGHSGYDFVPPISHAAWQRLGLDFAWLKRCFGEVSAGGLPFP